jgi:Zn-dependent membrane protease YugP
MSGGIIALAVAGLFCFLAGVYLAGEGNRTTGIALMSMGLIFQVVCLVQLKAAKKKGHSDAGR